MQAAAVPGSDPRPLISGFPLAPGVRLGKFEIVRELASGGMGKIYIARDTLTDVAVALKVLIPAPEAEPARLDRFKREGVIGWRLNHRNIIRIHDIGEDAGFYFISMELLDGEDLRAFLDREPRPDLTRIAGISLQVLAGLEFAHEQGVVHRDFKPQNIFLTTPGVVKLLDFGVAQALRISSHTTPGSMVGTPGYMSPEQAQGKPDLDARSDLYSWGVVLYEMLTGRLPFRCDNPIGVAAAHVYETPPPIRDVEPKVPLALAAVVMRCLEKNPAARYANVAQLREAFEVAMREAGAPVEQLAAAILNARTPTPKSAVGVAPSENQKVTKIIPRRLREAGAAVASSIAVHRLIRSRRSLFTLLLAAAVVLWWLWPTQDSYAHWFRLVTVEDLTSAQEPLARLGASNLDQARRLEAEATKLLSQARFADAREKVDRALALEPNLVYGRMLAGDLAAHDEDVDRARALYAQAIAAPQGLPLQRVLVSVHQAALALTTGERDEAQQHLDDAKRAGGEQLPEYHRVGGQLDMRRGDFASASQHIKSVQAMIPGDMSAEQTLAYLRRQASLQANAEEQRQIDDLVQTIVHAPEGKATTRARAPRDSWTSRPRTIWMLPVERSSSFERKPGFCIALEAGLEQGLLKVPGTELVERQLVAKLLSELKLGTSALAEPAMQLEIGHLTSARFLLSTTLTDLEGGSVVHWKVVDVETTEIVASDSTSSAANADPVDIAATIVASVDRELREAYPIRGRVTEVRADGTLVLNVGSEVGLEAGQVLAIRSPRPELAEARSPKVPWASGAADGLVLSVEPRHAIARAVDPNDPNIRQGAIAEASSAQDR